MGFGPANGFRNLLHHRPIQRFGFASIRLAAYAPRSLARSSIQDDKARLSSQREIICNPLMINMHERF